MADEKKNPDEIATQEQARIQAQKVADISPPEIYDDNGKLTRAGMEEAIRQGGSVLVTDAHGTRRVVSTLEDLPSEVDLAKGDTRRQAALKQSLDQQMAALAAQRAALEQDMKQPPPAAPRPPEEPSKAPGAPGGTPPPAPESPAPESEGSKEAQTEEQKAAEQKAAEEKAADRSGSIFTSGRRR